MFRVQYNRNTFNPSSRRVWITASTADTLQGAQDYLTETRRAFKACFGYPSDLVYRITKS